MLRACLSFVFCIVQLVLFSEHTSQISLRKLICPCLLCVCLHVVTKYSCTRCDFVFLVEIEMRKITTDICLNTFKKIFLGYFLLILWSNSKTFLSIIGFPEGKEKPQQINGMYLNTIFKHYNHCCSNYLKLLMHLNFTYSHCLIHPIFCFTKWGCYSILVL